jgi:transcriptional regulator with XRE-family HTH domain
VYETKRVGQAIARHRKSAGLTQAQLAEKLCLENESLSRIETGARQASLSRLEQLSDLFGCPVIRFFEEEEVSDEYQTTLQNLTDILQTLNPKERIFLVNFMIQAANLFRNRP